MGNLKLSLGFSVSSIASSAAYDHFYRVDIPYESEEITWIEERCKDLSNPLKILSGKHSYLIATTASGRKISYNYTEDSVEPDIKYDYWDYLPSDPFRKARALPGLKVSDANRIFRKHALKEDYHLFRHNCQHVARDSYNEITGLNEIALRNDFINWIINDLPKHMREEFKEEDDDYRFIKDHFENDIQALVDEGYTIEEIEEKVKVLTDIKNIRKVWEMLRKENYAENAQGLTEQQIKDLQRLFGERLTGSLEHLEGKE
ncbi:unnamed protein product [Blepharisma stoltei]|uniref:LRAT domain-containing protein n=1 Tax=Blepharisma stoltei TaxID=1481888 RepID=A0AAU9K571_9CILI|nr:unnamed protein product [Blepharisma stoltei]